MSTRSSLVILTAVCLLCGRASAADPLAPAILARSLANPLTRSAAIQAAVKSPARSLPILLRWIDHPPDLVHVRDLKVGMAEVFGRLRVRKAIPFLVSNIFLNDLPGPAAVWAGTQDEVLGRLPAVRALARIGPEAALALTRAREEKTGDEELAVELAICLTANSKATSLLTDIRNNGLLLMRLSQEGIEFLNRGGSQ